MTSNSNAIKNKLLSNCFSQKKEGSIFSSVNDVNCIDLFEYVNEKELNEWLHNSEKQKIIISKFKNPKELINELKETQNLNSFLTVLKKYKIENLVSKTLVKKLTTSFDSSKPKLINHVLEVIRNDGNKFIKLFKKAEEKFSDTAMWYMYVGAYFFCGKIGEYELNAPLFVYKTKISVDRTTNIIYLEKIEKEISTNAKLFFILNTLYKLNLEEINSTEIDDFKVIQKKLGRILINSFSGDNNFFADQKIKPFNLDEIKFSLYQETSCSILPYALLELIDPKGGIILQDVSKIYELGIDPFEINTLTKNKDIYVSEVNLKDDLVAINHNPNIYQKYTIKAALNKNVLIYGPPGTGKSETIANLIANILLNNKNVLMCSEKKAALDVLCERLGELNNLTLSIYNKKNKKEFFERISLLYDYIQNCGSPLSFKNTSITNNGIEYDSIAYENDLKNQIGFNNINKLNDFQKWYLLDNELLNLKLSTKLVNYLPLNANHINEIIDNSTYEKMQTLHKKYFNLEKEISFNEFKTSLEFAYKIAHFYDQYLDIINELWNKQLSISSQIASDYLQFYKNIKPKYQHYSLNIFINTFKKNKGNIFKNSIPKSYKKYDQNLLLNFLNELIKLKINCFDKNFYLQQKDFLKNYSTLTNEEFNKYNDIYQIKLLYEKYGYAENLNINSKINDYYDESELKANNNSRLIFNWYIYKINNEINEYKKSNEQLYKDIKEVFRISKLKRFPSISKTLSRYYKVFRIIFPIWVMSPIEISVNTPNEAKIFDYGIFDEASQMLVEDSYAAVYRCNLICVAGDDKQLKPSSFFKSKYKADETEADEDINYLVDSLFDKAKNSLWYEFYLKNHYRSVSAQLIEFSNKYIYDNKLETATKNGFFNQAIEVFDVEGIWDGSENIKEIEEIIKYLKNNYSILDFKNKKSILIVTCNIKQKEELDHQIQIKINDDEQHILRAIESSLIKTRNIENVQGDEADMIIFSLTYGPSNLKTKTVRQFFGPLSQDGGKNRLNVAITRAKEKMIVFKSFKASALLPSENDNNEVFRKFIVFLDSIKEKENISKTKSKLTLESNLDFKNNFQRDLYENIKYKIEQNSFNIKINVKIGSKIIDIAFIDKNTSKIVLGLQLDDLKEHDLLLNDVMINIDQQNFLKSRNYKIIRIREMEWIQSHQKIINLISSTLESK